MEAYVCYWFRSVTHYLEKLKDICVDQPVRTMEDVCTWIQSLGTAKPMLNELCIFLSCMLSLAQI